MHRTRESFESLWRSVALHVAPCHLFKALSRPHCTHDCASRYPAAVEMTRHFFQVEDLTASEHDRLRVVFGDGVASFSAAGGIGGNTHRITPATVEQLAGEHDSVGDFIEALEALF